MGGGSPINERETVDDAGVRLRYIQQMTPKEKFGKRLCSAMKEAGLEPSGTVLEGVFNRNWKGTPVSVQSAWTWINGKSLPHHERLLALAAALRVDPHWLVYGTDRATAAPAQRSWEDRVNYSERETIEAFLLLPAAQRAVVRNVILAFAKAYGKAKPPRAR